MQTVAAALTMVRDDAFFLKAWVRHYGEALGRENCYIVNHGRGPEVAQLAEGCNIIGIPGDPHPNFDMKRWRMLNHFVSGLRPYYDHVIVGDVDELVVVDPASGQSLLQFLNASKKRRFVTPLGLEVLHRVDIETEEIGDHIIGPRRHVRLAPHYSKPCIVSHPGKIARGGHFAEYDTLHTPDALYLLHLKYCDFRTYVEVSDHRNAVTAQVGGTAKDTSIGRHWFASARGDDRALFESFAAREMKPDFDFDWVRRRMHRSWSERGDKGMWAFDRPEYAGQYVLPDRFVGVV